jgi:conjugative transposon TraN protein
MKRIIPLLFCCITYYFGYSQSVQFTDSTPLTSVSSLPVKVTTNKTTNLVFPFKVRNVDRGIPDLLVQTVDGASHILQLKAATASMQETSLSVVTDDLHLYSFLVQYDSFPPLLNYVVNPKEDPVFFKLYGSGFSPHSGLTAAAIEGVAQEVASRKGYRSKPKDYNTGIALKVNGLYISRNMLFFSLQLENGTPIPYAIESLEMLIRDKKKGKRTATQDIPVHRQLALGDTSMIDGHTGQRLVIAVPMFTIPDKKDCIIQLREANGGRHLECTLGNKDLVRAREITVGQ